MTSSGLHNPSSTFILPPNSSEYVLLTGSIIQARRLCEDEQTPAGVGIRSRRLVIRDPSILVRLHSSVGPLFSSFVDLSLLFYPVW